MIERLVLTQSDYNAGKWLSRAGTIGVPIVSLIAAGNTIMPMLGRSVNKLDVAYITLHVAGTAGAVLGGWLVGKECQEATIQSQAGQQG